MPQPEPSRDEAAVRTFIENFSALLTEYGIPRMAARVMTAEMTAEGEGVTAADLAEQLGASPAAVSTALKYLTHLGLIVREPIPNSRRDRYRAVDHGWYTATLVQSGGLERMGETAAVGVDAVGGTDTVAGRRLAEMRDFYRFLIAELDGIMVRWMESRREADSAGEPR